MSTTSPSSIADKLAVPLNRVISDHGPRLRALLAQDGPISTALENDEKIRTAARFCYPLLPGVVRLVVKEPAFVNFVLAHRHQVLGKLAYSPAAG